MHTFARRNRHTSKLVRLTVLLAGVAACSLASAGSIISVTNSNDQLPWTMSDLIVYGKNGEKKTIAELGNPADDVVIGPSGQRTFDAGFEVDSYFISTQVGTSEFESVVLKVKQLGPTKLGWVQSASGETIVASLEYGASAVPPTFNSFFDIFAGVNPDLPGWFFGTTPDFQNGTVSGPFQGQARFVSANVDVAAVPEPGIWAMLAGGLCLLLSLRRRSR